MRSSDTNAAGQKDTTSPLAAAHYRPEIDGLRAVAVIMALFFHADVSAFSGGFVGADVFFVISGYLISSIVLREKRAGTFSFVAFYERRVRRIMPALLTMLGVSAVCSLMLLPEDLVAYARSLVAAVTFGSNFYFWKSLGYFGIEPLHAPLLNTWSLSVEEQLYLVLPFLIVTVWARFGTRGVTAFIVAAGSAALLLGLFVVDRIVYAGFFWPIFRAVEFLLGTMIALGAVPQLRTRWMNDALAMLGLALILSVLPRVYASPYFPKLEVLAACSGTVLFIYGTSTRDGLVTRLMSVRPVVLMGQASYSLYLWHWPIIAFGTYYILDQSLVPAAKVALAFASIPVAFLSWRYVEQPFRGRTALPSRRATFLLAAGCSLALALFGAVLIVLKGVPSRFDTKTLLIVADNVKAHNPCHGQSARSVAEGRLCLLGSPQAQPTFIVWGDSHADMYFKAFDELGRRHDLSGYMFSGSACRSYIFTASEAADANCATRNAEIRRLVLAGQFKAVVIIQRWSTATAAKQAGRNNDPRGARWLAELDAGLDEMASLVRDAGSALYLVRDVPEAASRVADSLAKARILGLGEERGHPPTYLKLAITPAAFHRVEEFPNALLDAFAERFPVRFLEPHRQLCDAEQCRVALDGLPLYRDSHHINTAGAHHLAPAFEPLMRFLSQR